MMERPNHFPEIWNDDERMAVLFSPFRDRSLNPSSWDKKMAFWTNLINDDCRICGDLFLEFGTLPKKYERKGKMPSCLQEVLLEMERSGKLINIRNVTVAPLTTDKGWLTWGFDTFVKSPVKWGWNYMKNNKSHCKDKYIHVDVLKEKCRKVCESHYLTVECDITDSVVEYNELRDRNRAICRTDEEYSLVMQELIKEKKITVHQTDSQMLVKFGRKDTPVSQVLEQDLNVYRLKKACGVLMSRIDKLGHDVDRLTVDAKMYIRKEMKQYAIRCLRQRKRLQNRIEKLMGSLDTLDDVLGRIRHAVSDEVILKAIQSGTDALKSLTEKVSLDEVTTTMDNLGDVLDQQNEIEAELSMDTSRLDISELEQELEDLIQEDVCKKPFSEGNTSSHGASPVSHRASSVQLDSDVCKKSSLEGNTSEHGASPVRPDSADDEDLTNMLSKVTLSDTPPKVSQMVDKIDDLPFPEVPKFCPELVHNSTPKVVKSSDQTKVKELAF